MNPPQPKREKISPDYEAAFHDVEVVEITEARHAVSLMKRIVEFIMTCGAPGVVAVLTPLWLTRMAASLAERGTELSANALVGIIAIGLMVLSLGGAGLLLEWTTNNAKISEKTPDLPPQSRNGESARQKLETLRDQTEANSLSEVVQRALALYEFLHGEKAKGNALVVKAPDGGEKEVILL